MKNFHKIFQHWKFDRIYNTRTNFAKICTVWKSIRIYNTMKNFRKIFQHCNENAVAFEITIQGQNCKNFVLFGNPLGFTIQK